MTCMECGIPYYDVDEEAIYRGYQLAFPENAQALDDWMIGEDEYRDW